MESFNLFPINCYNCDKLLGHLQLPYESLIAQGYTPNDAMNELKIKNYCCRMRVMSPAVIPYSPLPNNTKVNLPLQDRSSRSETDGSNIQLPRSTGLPSSLTAIRNTKNNTITGQTSVSTLPPRSSTAKISLPRSRPKGSQAKLNLPTLAKQ